MDAALKSDIEAKIEDLKKVQDSDDPETIKQATDALAQASHKLAEQLYAQQNTGAEGAAGPEGAANAGAAGADEDVVDADFTEVKDEKNNSRASCIAD